MTDQELLTMAAKAAGYMPLTNGQTYSPEAGNFDWNPLADDGDAFRLAVKLHIGVRTHGPDHWLQKNVAVALWDAGERSGRVTIQADSDFLRATRRAIVRAAAEIWRNMK